MKSEARLQRTQEADREVTHPTKERGLGLDRQCLSGEGAGGAGENGSTNGRAPGLKVSEF